DRRGGMKQLHEVLFGPYGQIGAFDDAGQQVPTEQVSAHYRVLREMDRKGVLRPDTWISLVWENQRVPWEEFRRERAPWIEFQEPDLEAGTYRDPTPKENGDRAVQIESLETPMRYLQGLIVIGCPENAERDRALESLLDLSRWVRRSILSEDLDGE